VTLTAWDLVRAEYLKERELAAELNAIIDVKDSNHNNEVKTKCKSH
jgi:hypothetical protein